MTRSATWWLLASAVSAGLVGVVLKATDVLGPGAPGASRTPPDDARDLSPPHPNAPLAADAGRQVRPPSAPTAAAPEPAASGEDELARASRDLPGSAPARDVAPGDGGVERARPHGTRARRSARERASAKRRAEGGSLQAAAVGDDGGAPLEPSASGSMRAAAQPAPAAASRDPAERGTPDVAPASDLNFTSGEERQFTTDTPVEIADMPNVGGAAGTLSFWLQPTWEDGNQDDASLLELGDGRLRIVKNVGYLRFEWTDDAGGTGGIGAPIEEWKPGEWHAVTTTWNGTSYALYIDGRLVSEKADAGHVGLPSDATLVIGSNFPENRPVAPGVIGNVDVRRRPLTAGEVANRFAAVTGAGAAGAKTSPR